MHLLQGVVRCFSLRANRGHDLQGMVAAVTNGPDRSKKNGNHGSRMKPLTCRMFPCYNPKCDRTHQPGQQVENERKWELNMKLRSKDFCPSSHETGNCPIVDRCKFQHGKSTGSQICEHVKNDTICQAFFSDRGCPKSHRLA